MRRSAQLVAAIVCVVGAVGAAEAQQDRRVGVVIEYPASFGMLWHVTDRVALRPDVTLSWTTTETTSTLNVIGGPTTTTTTSDTSTRALGLSGLFYLGPPQDLRFYVVPRVAYIWTSSESETSPPLLQLGPYESDGTGVQASGAFGAQYAVHERFRVFGELGVGYTRQESETGYAVSRTTLEQRGFGLRSGVGVVVMF